VSNGLKGYKPDTARWPVLRHGVIFFNGGSVVCFVLNRSRGGAGLVLQSDLPLPVVFDLEIDGENMRRRCIAVWRDQCRLGVSFDLDRLAEIAPDDEAVEAELFSEPALLEREQSLARLRSVLRFVGLANVYKAAVTARADATARMPENPDLPVRYKSGRS
jgi:hypothetical protein